MRHSTRLVVALAVIAPILPGQVTAQGHDLSVAGASAKEYMDKMKAAGAKIPGLPLRAETHAIVSGKGQGSDMKSVQEITAIHMITAAPSLFEAPADYGNVARPGFTPPDEALMVLFVSLQRTSL